MSDYIKREDAEQELQHFCDDMLHHFTMNYFAEKSRVKDCIAIIRKVPSVDVVEVVRCKDCMYGKFKGNGVLRSGAYCSLLDRTIKRDGSGYCYFAEKKEQENE